MKIHIEMVAGLPEDEILIKCSALSDTIQDIHRAILDAASQAPKLTFYKKNEAYFFPLAAVLFFETGGEAVYAHTGDDVFRIKLRLYELENILPSHFIRVSKSTILNSRHILSITRNLTSASLVQFHNSHKQVFVSRHYYNNLRQRLNERSTCNED